MTLAAPSATASNPVAGDVVAAQLRWRYATKVFDPNRKVSAGDWKVLEEALLLSPSSFGLQPWKFVVVTKQDVKEQLVAASWNQRQLADASHVVAFAVRRDLGLGDIDRHIHRVSAVRGIAVETLAAYRDMMSGALLTRRPGFDVNDWAARQVYIALGNFMTCAAMMGIDTCPLEGIVPEKYDEILGIDTRAYRTCVAAVAGYRAADDKYATLAKVRYASNEVIEHIA
ncbi:MAG: NAD(P)H-dependent oxidoreductase [Phycisphaerales bacterium]|nr:NAD(P)H-dependent oxidoreductase [Phycisphaerales bacterium]